MPRQLTSSLKRFSTWALSVAGILVAMQFITPASGQLSTQNRVPLKVSFLSDNPFVMNMSETRQINVSFKFDRDLIPQNGSKLLMVSFRTITLSPQFNIVELEPSNATITILKNQLITDRYQYETKLTFTANYIGRAILEPYKLEFADNFLPNSVSRTIMLVEPEKLSISIVQEEGIMGKIFIFFVTVMMIFSYVVMGAQIDMEKVERLIRRPKTLIIGFLITSIVMPVVSWIVGQIIFKDQLIYRIGSFVFACCPAAMAASLWASLLDEENNEFAIGLQVISTLGGLVTMPVFIYLMETALAYEGIAFHDLHLQVPYFKLITTLLTLLLAVGVGARFVGRHECLSKIAQRIYRPLLFSFLLSIIVFSATVYWHIYRLFDMKIVVCSTVIVSVNFLLTKVLGYLINRSAGQSLAVAISSTYKSSGIAISVLLVAYGPPDSYIAYVPCLMQILITSFSLYLFGGIARIAKRCCAVYSTDELTDDEEAPADSKCGTKRQTQANEQTSPKTVREGSSSPDEMEPLNMDSVNSQALGPNGEGRIQAGASAQSRLSQQNGHIGNEKLKQTEV